MHRAVVVLLLVVAGASCSDGRSDPEGPCFEAGESCGLGVCGQVEFCLIDAGPPTCVHARDGGAGCIRDAECLGTCDAGSCAGPIRLCPRF